MAETGSTLTLSRPTSEGDPGGPPGGPPAGAGDPSAQFHARRWRKHKFIAFALGGLGGGLAGFANTAYGFTFGLPFALVHRDLFLIVLVVVIAPLVEEHVKFLALLLLRAEEKATYTPRRWMVLGMIAGAGFGVAEAFLYWQAIATVSFTAANLNLFIRVMLTVPLHALTVSATGYGFGLARMQRSNGPLVRGLAIAILAHAAFNAFQTVDVLGMVAP